MSNSAQPISKVGRPAWIIFVRSMTGAVTTSANTTLAENDFTLCTDKAILAFF